ncbi:hypothetical protein FH972_000637 [Carpinus fangiana]|uniref:Uncharacterized protein n=1 Tax=Carpinus fangiana TaxID=176857 RepID=A0A5N6QBY1_9ROSI|nr:hypothetical protein FH972_000637 [Carpinus fangiana]
MSSLVSKLGLGLTCIKGSIPSDIGNLSSLTALNLRTNELDGPIPATVGRLHMLEGLFLQSSKLQPINFYCSHELVESNIPLGGQPVIKFSKWLSHINEYWKYEGLDKIGFIKKSVVRWSVALHYLEHAFTTSHGLQMYAYSVQPKQSSPGSSISSAPLLRPDLSTAASQPLRKQPWPLQSCCSGQIRHPSPDFGLLLQATDAILGHEAPVGQTPPAIIPAIAGPHHQLLCRPVSLSVHLHTPVISRFWQLTSPPST